MRRTPLRGGAAIVAMGWLVLSLPLAAHADSPAGTPLLRTSHRFPNGYMEYSVDPGKRVDDTVTVENAGTAPAGFVLFAADGLTSVVSGVVYGDRDHPLRDGPTGNGEYGAGSWIALSSAAVQLAPGEKTTVALSVSVPAQTAPGDYVGAVSAENPVPSRGTGQFGLNVTTRTTIAVVVHVPGPVATGGVTMDTPYVTVENKTRQILNVPLSYRGDVLVKPLIDLRVLDASGNTLLRVNRRLDTFVPHSTIIFPIPFDQVVVQPGQYHVVSDFGPEGAEQHFDLQFGVTAPEAQVPAPADRGPRTAVQTSPSARLPSWLLPAVLGGSVALIALGVILFLRARGRRLCAHCGRAFQGRTVAVESAGNAGTCARCRSSLSRRGTRVRLCAECFAGHRGWQRTG